MTEGLAMGNPLSGTLANIFLAHFESDWQKQPFAPKIYTRFLDDTFTIFKSNEDADKFFTFINNQFPTVKFTKEIGGKNLAFLYADLTLEIDEISTTVYRKPTYTNLLLSNESICPDIWKHNLITGMLHRAYKITFSWPNFHNEVQKIIKIMSMNGYTINWCRSKINDFLNKKMNPTQEDRSIIDRPRNIIMLPYYGEASYKFRRKLKRIFRKMNAEVSIMFNSFKIKNYFSLKSKTPRHLKSTIVYKFECQVDPEVSYIGKTKRWFFKRVAEHRKPNSAIYDHLLTCNQCANNVNESFSIIYQGRKEREINIVETLYISEKYPTLNRTLSSQGKSAFLRVFY